MSRRAYGFCNWQLHCDKMSGLEVASLPTAVLSAVEEAGAELDANAFWSDDVFGAFNAPTAKEVFVKRLGMGRA